MAVASKRRIFMLKMPVNRRRAWAHQLDQGLAGPELIGAGRAPPVASSGLVTGRPTGVGRWNISRKRRACSLLRSRSTPSSHARDHIIDPILQPGSPNSARFPHSPDRDVITSILRLSEPFLPAQKPAQNTPQSARKTLIEYVRTKKLEAPEVKTSHPIQARQICSVGRGRAHCGHGELGQTLGHSVLIQTV